MATAAGMNRSGICSNFGNCSIADARSTVELATGMDLVCTECGKPLLLKGATSSSAGGRTGMIVAGIALALVLAGAGAWTLFSKMAADGAVKPAPATADTTIRPAPATAAGTSKPAPATADESIKPVPAAQAGQPSGDCSPADEKAGICKMQR